ncbi:MAG: hypothetical protein ABI321_02595 [Polyangia bacterium]
MTDTDHTLALRRIGREAIGPAFCVYLHRVIERSHSLGLDRLMFLAREGHVFRMLYDQLAPRLSLQPLPTSYLYVSRLSTALPAVQRFGLREMRLAWRRAGGHTPRGLLRTFGLDEAPLLPRLYAAGFLRADEPIVDWWGDMRFDRLLDDELFQARVAEQASAARGRLRRYLAAESYFESRVGLVDIGWGGTIQDALTRAFRDEGPALHGLYFGLGEAAETYSDPTLLGAKEGLFSDYRRHRGLPGRAVFAFLELFEQAARAPHGTTLGYEDLDGNVVPVLKESGRDRDAERRSDVLIAAILAGVREAADDYLRAPSRWASERLESTWVSVDRLVFSPTRAELDAISSLSHSVDWGGDVHRSLGGTPFTLYPRALKQQFDLAFWKSGFLRSIGGPLLPKLYRRYLASKP